MLRSNSTGFTRAPKRHQLARINPATLPPTADSLTYLSPSSLVLSAHLLVRALLQQSLARQPVAASFRYDIWSRARCYSAPDLRASLVEFRPRSPNI
ncbi:hypothetical protein IWW57_001066 [Coemansia sp. S610]|nr:hypothetical protein IWW57_001066 [Coemansia sp. S610]